ncbi:hypothetical protein CRUP_017057 [Coryphaenoides rupestris]|nr:hypothetical protein CRUP_017057 [Coryphaenoides rupestris]
MIGLLQQSGLRQYPGEPPQFLLYITGIGNTKTADSLVSDKRFSTELTEEKTVVDLKISSAAVTDSALYYCALRPTGSLLPRQRARSSAAAGEERLVRAISRAVNAAPSPPDIVRLSPVLTGAVPEGGGAVYSGSHCGSLFAVAEQPQRWFNSLRQQQSGSREDSGSKCPLARHTGRRRGPGTGMARLNWCLAAVISWGKFLFACFFPLRGAKRDKVFVFHANSSRVDAAGTSSHGDKGLRGAALQLLPPWMLECRLGTWMLECRLAPWMLECRLAPWMLECRLGTWMLCRALRGHWCAWRRMCGTGSCVCVNILWDGMQQMQQLQLAYFQSRLQWRKPSPWMSGEEEEEERGARIVEERPEEEEGERRGRREESGGEIVEMDDASWGEEEREEAQEEAEMPEDLKGVHTHTFKLKPFKKAKSCDICKQAITKEGMICKGYHIVPGGREEK